jgi:hypothetical protein
VSSMADYPTHTHLTLERWGTEPISIDKQKLYALDSEGKFIPANERHTLFGRKSGLMITWLGDPSTWPPFEDRLRYLRYREEHTVLFDAVAWLRERRQKQEVQDFKHMQSILGEAAFTPEAWAKRNRQREAA